MSIKQARPQAYLSSRHVMSVMKQQSLKSIGIKSSIEFRGTELSVEKNIEMLLQLTLSLGPESVQSKLYAQTHDYANSEYLFKPMFQHC